MDTKFSVTSDTYLWNDFRSGDDLAFVKIYKIFVDVLFRYGIKFSSDEDLVKDSIQELFIELYNHRQTLGTTNNIKLYLLKSLKRRIIKDLSVKSVYLTIDETEALFLVNYTDNDAFSGEQVDPKRDTIQRALNELTSRQKEAIYLRFNTGLSYEEICEAMDMNYQSVRNLVFRAVEKMRAVLSLQKNIFLFYFLKSVKEIKN